MALVVFMEHIRRRLLSGTRDGSPTRHLCGLVSSSLLYDEKKSEVARRRTSALGVARAVASETTAKYSARPIRFVLAAFVLLFSLLVQVQLATAYELILKEDGSKVDAKSLVLSRGWASDGIWDALRLYQNLYISMKLCPAWWGRDDDNVWAHTKYKILINNNYKEIREYVPYKKCELSLIFDRARRLSFTEDFMADNFIKRYTPATMFLHDSDQGVNVLKGTIEYESASTGKQTIAVYNHNGIKVCEGTQEILLSKKGDFSLFCFDGKLTLQGFTELRDAVFGTTHSVSSGTLSSGGLFVIVTNLIGEKLNEKYNDIETKKSIDEIVKVLSRASSDNVEKNPASERPSR